MQRTEPSTQRDSNQGDKVVLCHISEIARPEDSIAWVADQRRAGQSVFYWETPSLTLAASGCTWEAVASGPERFRTIQQAVRELAGTLRVESTTDLVATPPLLGGFAFADEIEDDATWSGFAASRLFLPATCIVVAHDRAALLRNVEIDRETDIGSLARRLAASELPGIASATPPSTAPELIDRHTTPERDTWMETVRSTVDAIRGGNFDKLVLARSRNIVGDRDFDLEHVLHTLREQEAGCTIFCVSGGNAEFVGATPETLVTLTNGVMQTSAVAGTAPRGDTSDTDGILRHALELSDKDRDEHDFVIRGITDDLEEHCTSLECDETPRVLGLHNVQHLRTAISGTAKEGRGVLDLVEALHPSPAVGGYPKQTTRDELAAREGFERGWYAAPVGWTSVDGDGEFAVALRSGVLRKDRATTFAGAGIVRDSDPRAELAEIDLKFEPMAAALGTPR